jgi:hypothetical protein
LGDQTKEPALPSGNQQESAARPAPIFAVHTSSSTGSFREPGHP